MPKKSFSPESEIFIRGVRDIITKDELTGLLKSGKSLRIKHGIDATSPDLHVGHAANLWKLRLLQEAGHKAVVLLGDVTTEIGDPTGRIGARPILSRAAIQKNVRAIEKQVRAILLTNPRVFEFRTSSEWYGKVKMSEFLRLLSFVTHARLIERDMFQGRIRAGNEIYMHEIIYPVLQGYDSVMLKSDMTVIGEDQLFNEHIGRMLQERFGQKPQVIVTLALLPGLEGKEKMSKSAGNYIGLRDTPQDKFGKAMRVPDALVVPYLESYTDVSLSTIQKMKRAGVSGKERMDAKLFLAEMLVYRYHGANAAEKERQRFLDRFSRRIIPTDLPTRTLSKSSWDITDLLCSLALAPSKTVARRLVLQHAVFINGTSVDNPSTTVHVRGGSVVQAGRRNIVRVIIK